MQILRTADEMSAWSRAQRRLGKTLGFVPTMGFLHAGHASLMDLARPRCDALVVSVYVNPLQFGPREDLARYPRDPEGDARLCAQHGVDVLFMPAELYPDGFSTSVHVHGLTEGLCGARRPGHFEGVATVCARLFGVTGADLAVFGDKDFQQLMVIRRMVLDLAIPVQIVPGPLVRDTDGVALSSRNKYLSPEERRRARTLSEALFAMRGFGEARVDALVAFGRSRIDCDRLDYLEVVDAETLRSIEVVADRPAGAGGGGGGGGGADVRLCGIAPPSGRTTCSRRSTASPANKGPTRRVVSRAKSAVRGATTSCPCLPSTTSRSSTSCSARAARRTTCDAGRAILGPPSKSSRTRRRCCGPCRQNRSTPPT